MMAATKLKIRSNKAQIDYLCQYMSVHKDFAAGEFKTPLGADRYNQQWTQLQAALHELGPHRSIEQWKVCWRDQKRKARAEGGALSRAHNPTGNYVGIPELSQNSVIILDTIGKEMAIGVGPQESPIGFAVPISPPLPPPPPPQPQPSLFTEYEEPDFPPPPPLRNVNSRRNVPTNEFLDAQNRMNALTEELVREVIAYRREEGERRRESNTLQLESNSLQRETNYLLRKLCRSRRR